MRLRRPPPAGVVLDFSLVAPGGSRTYAVGFLDALAELGPGGGDVTVMLPARPGELADQESSLRDAGITVERIGSSKPAGTWSSRIVGQVALPVEVRRRRPSVTFVAREAAPILLTGRRVLLARNVLRWGQSQDSLPFLAQRWEGLADRVAAYGVGRAAKTIVPSRVIGEMLPEATPYEVVPYGVGLDAAPVIPRTLSDHRPLRVVTLGALTRHKRLDVVMDAAAALVERGEDVILDLWGPALQPDEAERLHHHADRVLGDRCTFHGPVDPAGRAEVLGAADVLAFGSGTESFGFPMIEAMRSATLLLAPDTPITREMCGSVAAYYETGDAESAADRLAELLTDDIDQITARLTDGVTRSLLFTWGRCVAETMAVLHAVAGDGHDPD